MTVDHDYVSSLLNIAEKCTGHSGKLSNLQSWAIGELMRVNGEIKADAVEGKKQADAEAAAEAQQKATGLPKEPGVIEPEHFEPEHNEVLVPGPNLPGDPNIYTSDNPNPNLADRRI